MFLKAKHAFLQQLIADGVDTVFGNPGTFEQGLLDALQDYPQIHYILGLQEAAVVAMATNYARLGKRPAVAQLHAGIGLGNAMGALQEAYRGEVPILVICGENEQAAEPYQGYLACDLVELARPVTRWAVRVTDPAQLLRITREAWQRAMTVPRGPVLLALPMDMLEQPVHDIPEPSALPPPLSPPSDSDLAPLTTVLKNAKQPIMLLGDALAWSGAEAEACELADLIGARMWGMNLTMAGNLLAHQRFEGFVGYTSGEAIAEVTRQADALLTIGATLGTEVFPLLENRYLRDGVFLYQLDPNPHEIGKNVKPTLGLTSDPKATLQALIRLLHAQGAKASSLPARAPRPAAVSGGGKLTADHMMSILVSLLPPETLVADESMSAAESLRTALRTRLDVTYLSCLSRGLGSGWPGGIAAKLLYPERPVVALCADGAAMYILPALWTAAHCRLNVVFITCNNHAYAVLKRNLAEHWRRTGETPRSYPFMDLDDPPITFDRIAAGMGVKSWRATDEASLKEMLLRAINTPGPHLIDIEMA